MKKITEQEVKNKIVLVRADLNCPVKDKKITSDIRIRAHAKTINDLSERGARVIVLSHQGRKGTDDFIGLEQHAKILCERTGKEVHFVKEISKEAVKRKIDQMKDGEIIVLENVRYFDCETEHPEGMGRIVEELSSLADYFVLDALSVAHRKHSSVVGLAKRVESFAGEILATEIGAVEKVKHSKEVTFVFGGSKVEDSFKVMKIWLKQGKVRKILVGGALSVLFLHAKGYNIGDSIEYLKNSGLTNKVPEAKKLMEEYGDVIVLPADIGLSVKMQRIDRSVEKIDHGEIWDIGEKTIEFYLEEIKKAQCIVMNGPMGVYEIEDFSKGTRMILEGIAKSDAFSLIGGGHTISAINKFNIDSKYFSYVSLSGKALIEYLCGEKLPGLVALEENEKMKVCSRC